MEEQRQERSSSPRALFFTSRLPAVQHWRPILPPGVEQMGNDAVSSSETIPTPFHLPSDSLFFLFGRRYQGPLGPSWHHRHLKASLPLPEWHVTI